jgi:phosphopantothenoylcysteine decarboxylase/phosphopantothenate--cysteine ligase
MSEGVHNGLDEAALSEGAVVSSAEEPTGKKKLFHKVVLAVTGSVGAAVEIPRFSFLLRRLFVEELTIVLSRSAQRFVSPYVATLCAGRAAVTDGETTEPYLVPHVQVTKGADLLLVMPATANILAKAAHGIADDIVSATILAALCPVTFVPNMNGAMWANAATRANVLRLKEFGHQVIEPTWGTEVATLERTFGAMPAFSQILRSVASAVKARGLQEAQL